MIGMRDNSLKHWLVQEYSNAVIWLVRETHSKEQSDWCERYTLVSNLIRASNIPLCGKKILKKMAAGKKSLNPVDHMNATQTN